MRRMIRAMRRADDVLEYLVRLAFCRARSIGAWVAGGLALALLAIGGFDCAGMKPHEDPAEVLVGIWLDRIPPDSDEEHLYFFAAPNSGREGMYQRRRGQNIHRERFKWSVAGGRLTFTFDTDGRKVSVPFKVEPRAGDGYDHTLELAKDPCRDDKAQTYLRRKKG